MRHKSVLWRPSLELKCCPSPSCFVYFLKLECHAGHVTFNGPCESFRQPNAITPIWLRRVIRSLDRDGIHKHSQTGINGEGGERQGISTGRLDADVAKLFLRPDGSGPCLRYEETDGVWPRRPVSSVSRTLFGRERREHLSTAAPPKHKHTHWPLEGEEATLSHGWQAAAQQFVPISHSKQEPQPPNLISGIIWQRQIWHIRQGREIFESRLHCLLVALRVGSTAKKPLSYFVFTFRMLPR